MKRYVAINPLPHFQTLVILYLMHRFSLEVFEIELCVVTVCTVCLLHDTDNLLMCILRLTQMGSLRRARELQKGASV